MMPFTAQQQLSRPVIIGFFILSVTLIGLGIGVMVVNGEDLLYEKPQCTRYSIFHTCQAAIQGCYISANQDDHSPCQYAYAVGAVTIAMELIVFSVQMFHWSSVVNVFVACFDVAWWLVAGIYFSLMYNEADKAATPFGSSRQQLLALCWASLAVSALQVPLAAYNFARMKRYTGSRYKAKGKEGLEGEEGDEGEGEGAGDGPTKVQVRQQAGTVVWRAPVPEEARGDEIDEEPPMAMTPITSLAAAAERGSKRTTPAPSEGGLSPSDRSKLNNDSFGVGVRPRSPFGNFMGEGPGRGSPGRGSPAGSTPASPALAELRRSVGGSGGLTMVSPATLIEAHSRPSIGSPAGFIQVRRSAAASASLLGSELRHSSTGSRAGDSPVPAVVGGAEAGPRSLANAILAEHARGSTTSSRGDSPAVTPMKRSYAGGAILGGSILGIGSGRRSASGTSRASESGPAGPSGPVEMVGHGRRTPLGASILGGPHVQRRLSSATGGGTGNGATQVLVIGSGGRRASTSTEGDPSSPQIQGGLMGREMSQVSELPTREDSDF